LNCDWAKPVLEVDKGVHTVHFLKSMNNVSKVLVAHIIAGEDEFVDFGWHGIGQNFP
jgi:hypothetical protein